MTKKWQPPSKITELYAANSGNRFSSINRPTAGIRFQQNLNIPSSGFSLFSLATPNGQKAGIILEELSLSKEIKFTYQAKTISIMEGQQFGSDFVSLNPNSKIPCAVDFVDGKPIRLFEGSSILIYLADKYKKFIPESVHLRAECINWVSWAQVQAFVTGNYGHFFVYAPAEEKGARNYGVHRYGMDIQRMCSVLDQEFSRKKFLCGDQYTIADMAVFPWYELIRTVGYVFDDGNEKIATKDFLEVSQYKNLNRWADEVGSREAVQRGMLVCRKQEYPKAWLNIEDKRFSHLRTDEENAQLGLSKL
eukprot:snap_masked-scaffold_19-processed-gene-2.7-mRNA-1 protein AED:0.03 eAED:0.03 QI:0/-1/0/1/-1/1/1/0/305